MGLYDYQEAGDSRLAFMVFVVYVRARQGSGVFMYI